MLIPQPIEFVERNLYCPECHLQLQEKVRQYEEEITCPRCKWSTTDEDKIPYFMVFAPVHVLECEDVLNRLDRERTRQIRQSGEPSEFLEVFYQNVVEALKKADEIELEAVHKKEEEV